MISFGLTENYDVFGDRFVTTQQLLNILFLYYLIVVKILNIKLSNIASFIGFAIVCVVILILSKDKYNKTTYKELEKKYKYEKNRRLKGWLVVLYWFLSTVLFFAVLFI